MVLKLNTIITKYQNVVDYVFGSLNNDKMQTYGYGVTPVRDRNYFNAMYFREHGEILFEIATDPPGFAHDESQATMGEKLMLPEQYEPHREQIKRVLLPFEVRELN